MSDQTSNNGALVSCRQMATADFQALAYKDPCTIYFVNQTGAFTGQSMEEEGDIYLGDKLLTKKPTAAIRASKSGSGGEFPQASVVNKKYLRQTTIATPGVYLAYLTLTLLNPTDAVNTVTVGLFGGCCALGDLLSQQEVQRAKVTISPKGFAAVSLFCPVAVPSVANGQYLYHGYAVNGDAGGVDVLGQAEADNAGSQLSRIGIMRIGDYSDGGAYGLTPGAQDWIET